MKVLIIGDSLAAQRPDDDLDINERWPALLSNNKNVLIRNLSKGFSTTQRLREPDVIKEAIKSDIVIIQLGVVDCAPRRFKRWEMQLIYKLPGQFQKKIIAFLKKKKHQSTEKCYVKPPQFKKNIETFIKTIKKPVIYIQVLPATGKLLKSNPDISGAITKYNSIIEQLSGKMDSLTTEAIALKDVQDLTLEDDYHLNRKGHQYIARKILEHKEFS